MLSVDNTFIIAEIGVNHNGNIELAKEMIASAKLAGADAVKFQTFTAEALVSRATPKVNYQKETTPEADSHYDMIKSLELSHSDHYPIIECCRQLSIQFISTPYDVESAVFLDCIGVEVFKTASADIVDLPLHRFLAGTGKSVIISTGMSTVAEIREVMDIYEASGNSNVTLLHCVSNYPCEFNSLNLRVMMTLESEFRVPVGYSDHAVGVYPAVAAVAMGARVIEKHFTLDKTALGPDHKASSTPEEFKELVDAIRVCEVSLGSDQKAVQTEEIQMRQVSRKSIFVAKRIPKGSIIKLEDLTLKRPGTGLYAKSFSEIEGLSAKYDLLPEHMLSFDDVE
ncbi:N-acetylneuraminate synthase family protein [Amylibacter sp.]|nr:N-acetylneuraminate synthase family protein [Amylibacter sp.]